MDDYPIQEECKTIARIADRGVGLFAQIGIKVNKVGLIMDIEQVHMVSPLRLDEFHNAERKEFFHDVAGIYCYFNRETKTLENGFSPSFCQ